MPTSEAMARDDDCVARQRRISLQRSEDHEGQRRQRAERDLEDGAGADQALGARAIARHLSRHRRGLAPVGDEEAQAHRGLRQGERPEVERPQAARGWR